MHHLNLLSGPMSSPLIRYCGILMSLIACSTHVYAEAPANSSSQIDLIIQLDLMQNKMVPNLPANELHFVRRVYLDVIGRMPTAEELESFQTDKHQGRRARLIGELLDSTLVVVTTEFGRKPNFDGDGRSHHPVCFSTALAGGGAKAGFVYGRSDSDGYYVDEDAVSVGSFHASIGFAAGMELEKPAMSPSGRPMTIGDGEKPVLELFE